MLLGQFFEFFGCRVERFDSFYVISKVCLSGTQDTGNFLPSRNANSCLEHKQTEVISGGAEQTDRQGYAIKTSDYLFLFIIEVDVCNLR